MLQRIAEQDPSFQSVWEVKELEFSQQLELLEQQDASTQKEKDVLSEMERVANERTLAQKALLKEWFSLHTT